MARYSPRKQSSSEKVALGQYIHQCDGQLVVKLTHRDIPYPNSKVIFKNKEIGKIDEVFGSTEEPYVSVELDEKSCLKKIKEKDILEGYKDRFISKERFLPREEVEKRKEQKDIKNKKGGNNRKFNKDRSPRGKKNSGRNSNKDSGRRKTK